MRACVLHGLVILLLRSGLGVRNSSLIGRCQLEYPFECPSETFKCFCENFPETVLFDEIKHRNCIPISWVCDGFKDCFDGSDELDCFCPEGYFQCGCEYPDLKDLCTKSFTPPFCISNTGLCDGKNDCPTPILKDEANEKCGQTFRCDSGEYLDPWKVCDGWIECLDGQSDERECSTCPIHLSYRCNCNMESEMKCKQQYSSTCFSRNDICDGLAVCSDGTDELECNICPLWMINPIPCDCNRPNNCTCKEGLACYDEKDYCNGLMDCTDGTDEKSCPCPETFPIPCDCNNKSNFSCSTGRVCFNTLEMCDLINHCEDGSDERYCSCPEGYFACECFRKNPPECHYMSGCVDLDKVNNGRLDCPDNSDEDNIIDGAVVACESCQMTLFRLQAVSDCARVGFPNCDVSTCYDIPTKNYSDNARKTDVICLSYCSNKKLFKKCSKVFLCSSQGLRLTHQFCNGVIDCDDSSDEVRNLPGFKCTGEKGICVLPQINLYDNIAQCKDNSDLCFNSETNCFKCFDGRLLIGPNQVCDGVVDCYDSSDEYLCLRSAHKLASFDFLPTEFESLESNCFSPLPGRVNKKDVAGFGFNQSTVQPAHTHFSICSTKWGETRAAVCDGRPECKDFSDECKCSDPPSFCDDPCRFFFPLGDRYCDGYEDQAWVFINNSKCPKGFDEANCPMRFKCKVGNKISIDVSQLCDGINHCENGFDEIGCKASAEDVLSSDKEMISVFALRCFIWIMSILTVCGNVVVLYSTTVSLKKQKISRINKCNRFLLVNLSFSDLLMGLYLLVIGIKSAQYSGYYGQVDNEWRTSYLCSCLGCLAIVSSEASCFLMSILTAFRLRNLYWPFSFMWSSLWAWYTLPLFSWMLAVILAFIPILDQTRSYFNHRVWFGNRFVAQGSWTKAIVSSFACRLARITNSTVPQHADSWEAAKTFLEERFPKFSPKGEFGYYSEASVCIPKFYVKYGDNAWEYSVILLSVNFLSFMFVAFSYVLIYKNASKSRKLLQRKEDNQNNRMQKRIVRLLFTDFVCWIPICFMAYLKLAGVYLSSSVYAFSAVVLLPINSALNPLLYSPIAGDIIDKLWCPKSKSCLHKAVTTNYT